MLRFLSAAASMAAGHAIQRTMTLHGAGSHGVELASK